MDTLELLITCRSASHLVKPAPTGEQSQSVLRVDIYAPDHETLQSWQFFVIEGGGRECFSMVPERGAIAAGSDREAQDEACNVPSRALLIIIVVAKYEESDKVPLWEQEMFASCAVMAMQMAAITQGFDGVWRNGVLTESVVVHEVSDCHP